MPKAHGLVAQDVAFFDDRVRHLIDANVALAVPGQRVLLEIPAEMIERAPVAGKGQPGRHRKRIRAAPISGRVGRDGEDVLDRPAEGVRLPGRTGAAPTRV